jgi:hypothetical protein
MTADWLRVYRKLDEHSWLLTPVMLFVLLLPQGHVRWSCHFCGVDSCGFWVFVFCVESRRAAQESRLPLRTSGEDFQWWIDYEQNVILHSLRPGAFVQSTLMFILHRHGNLGQFARWAVYN